MLNDANFLKQLDPKPQPTATASSDVSSNISMDDPNRHLREMSERLREKKLCMRCSAGLRNGVCPQCTNTAHAARFLFAEPGPEPKSNPESELDPRFETCFH